MATYETILEATVKAGVEHFGGFPSGTMIAFAGKSVPDGWLLCNGALVSRTTYAKLFAAIGTAWGAGDGSTTFKLPDADGRVMQGVTDLSKVGRYLEAGLPNITGEFAPRKDAGAVADVNGSASILQGAFLAGNKLNNNSILAVVTGNSSSILKLNATRCSSFYGQSATVQPAALQTLIIIKV